ncbi:AAA family ATPase, partial [Youngiibacter fragilis]|uniref:AAA family ATPase n=1 Tax=Youngiibacter fragilis TaxID=1408819 RepID=UPI001A9A2D43
MHTPVDEKNWLGHKIQPGKEFDAAQEFAEACYQGKFDVVAITDHNFLSKDFIPYLREAFQKLEARTGHRIVLFPGFEFEAAGVGRGAHVICLFNPDSDLDTIDAILTSCGVAHPRVNQSGVFQKSDYNLKKILRIVQNAPNSGLVVLPHSLSDDGIFDDNNISIWLQQDQYTNPELLAVEVPKPVSKMSTNFKSLFKSDDSCLPNWRRIRPIATLMASDNKMLLSKDTDGSPKPNSIGYRYSWIKMSEPSIEALRQAFLDNQSRIYLPQDVTTDKNRNNQIEHSRIESLEIKNVEYLNNQKINFSPNMNCIIGGRGTGKSTILEYLRIAMGKERDSDMDQNTTDRVNRIKNTIKNSKAELVVCWKDSSGTFDKIVYRDGVANVEDRDLHDIDTYFKSLPLKFFSQQQLNYLTEGKISGDSYKATNRLVELIDGFENTELNTTEKQERALKIEIQDCHGALKTLDRLESELKILKQEYQEVERKWNAQNEIKDDAKKHEELLYEKRYTESINGKDGRQFIELNELAKHLLSLHVGFSSTSTPHAEWFREFDAFVKVEKDRLVENVKLAVEDYYRKVEGFLNTSNLWDSIKREIDAADSEFLFACEKRGLSSFDVGRVQEINTDKIMKSEELNELESDIEKRRLVIKDPSSVLKKLNDLWLWQFNVREKAAEKANRLAILQDSKHKFIEASLRYQGDS